MISADDSPPCDRPNLSADYLLGAAPVRLDIPGAAAAQLRYLHGYADSRIILAMTAHAQRVVVVGASFIGLGVAGSLCKRGIEVHVVGPRECR